MFRFMSADRILIIVAGSWLALLASRPALPSYPSAFFATIVLIAVNAAVSFRALTRSRQVLIGLNCAQIVLFGSLNFQLYCAFGAEHYYCDREPRLLDWAEFTIAHVLRAADFLDALDDYGIPIQVITHQSAQASLLLASMHLTVDVFLIGLMLRGLNRWWQDAQKETHLARGRREFGWLLATLALYAVFAVSLPLRPIDWLLWPLDQLVRLLDVGDVLQLFGWQLHGAEPTYWTRGAGLLFRVIAGVWMARLVIWLRMTMLRTWGVTIEELIELLDDADAHVRRGAAEGLGQSGVLARDAAPLLIDALRDLDPQVRVAAARALGRIGPPARAAAPALVEAVWLGHRELRLAAARALGEIGKDARSAAHALITLLKVCDAETSEMVRWALGEIAPDVLKRVLAVPSVRPSKKRRRRDYWKLSLDAARSMREMEEIVRTLLLLLVHEGFFDEERDTDAIRVALASKGHPVQFAQLFLPLLLLTSDGALAKRKSAVGRWLYFDVAVSRGSP